MAVNRSGEGNSRCVIKRLAQPGVAGDIPRTARIKGQRRAVFHRAGICRVIQRRGYAIAILRNDIAHERRIFGAKIHRRAVAAPVIQSIDKQAAAGALIFHLVKGNVHRRTFGVNGIALRRFKATVGDANGVDGSRARRAIDAIAGRLNGVGICALGLHFTSADGNGAAIIHGESVSTFAKRVYPGIFKRNLAPGGGIRAHGVGITGLNSEPFGGQGRPCVCNAKPMALYATREHATVSRDGMSPFIHENAVGILTVGGDITIVQRHFSITDIGAPRHLSRCLNADLFNHGG